MSESTVGELRCPFEDITTENTVFAFDLHHVLMEPQTWKAFCSVVFTFTGWRFMLGFLNPFLLLDLIKQAMKPGGSVGEEYANAIVKHHRAVEPFVLRLFNSWQLSPEMREIVNKLVANGFRVYLLSNIGKSLFADLKSRNEEFFDQFSGCYFTTPETNYLRKPARAAFDTFLKNHDLLEKQVIFVDDSEKNITSTSEFKNFGAIHFKSHSLLAGVFSNWKIFKIETEDKKLTEGIAIDLKGPVPILKIE